MSVATHDEHATEGHHESPEVIDHRQRLGIWLFIAGDVITFSALVFTYLYLKGTNTTGGWRSIVAFNFAGLNRVQANDLINNATPHRVFEAPVATGLNWLIVAVVVVSAALIALGESRIRNGTAKSFIPLGYLAAVVALVAGVFEIVQMRDIPQYFAVQNDSQLFVHTAYGSAMLAFGGALLAHLILLAFLGVGLSVRTSRGAVTAEKWTQVRLVRFFWVWVAISTVVTAIITSAVK